MRSYTVSLNGKPVFSYQLMTKEVRSEIFDLSQFGKVSIASFPEEALI